MAKVNFRVYIFSLYVFLFALSGCSMRGASSSNQPVTLESLSPIESGSSALWTRWIKVDAATIPDSTGSTACDVSDAGAGYDTCVNGGLTRKVKISNETNCNSVQSMSDSLGVFQWACVEAQDGSGLWIYSTAFTEGKGLNDLIQDASTFTWKEISVSVTTASNHYLSHPTQAWNDALLPLPDTSSARVDLDSPDTLYYLDSNATGKGVAFDSDHVGLVLLNGSTYTYDGATNQPVVLIDSKNFIYLEGTFDAASTADNVIEFATNNSKNTFIHINKVTAQNATAVGLNVPGEMHNLSISNLNASDNGTYGIWQNGTGGYYRLHYVNVTNNNIGAFLTGSDNISISNMVATDNTQIGLNLTNSKYIVLDTINASSNGTHGISLLDIEESELSNVTASYNSSIGVRLVADGLDLLFSNIEASNNGGIGVFIGGISSDLTLNNVVASDNGDHGISLDQASLNISGASIQADRNAGHGLNVANAVSGVDLQTLSFSENTQNGFYIGSGSLGVNLTNIQSDKAGANGATIEQGSSGTIKDLVISNATQVGLQLASQTTVIMTNIEILNTGSYGLEVSTGAEPSLTNLSIESPGNYAIYEHGTGPNPVLYFNVSITHTPGDAIFIENGSLSTYDGIYFDHITGYLVAAQNGPTVDFYNLSYGTNVDTLNLYNIDTGTGANVTVH